MSELVKEKCESYVVGYKTVTHPGHMIHGDYVERETREPIIKEECGVSLEGLQDTDETHDLFEIATKSGLPHILSKKDVLKAEVDRIFSDVKKRVEALKK